MRQAIGATGNLIQRISRLARIEGSARAGYWLPETQAEAPCFAQQPLQRSLEESVPRIAAADIGVGADEPALLQCLVRILPLPEDRREDAPMLVKSKRVPRMLDDRWQFLGLVIRRVLELAESKPQKRESRR